VKTSSIALLVRLNNHFVISVMILIKIGIFFLIRNFIEGEVKVSRFFKGILTIFISATRLRASQATCIISANAFF